jgi:hypothetical protein
MFSAGVFLYRCISSLYPPHSRLNSAKRFNQSAKQCVLVETQCSRAPLCSAAATSKGEISMSLGESMRTKNKIATFATFATAALCTVLLAMHVPVRASGGRDFAGFYELTNVTTIGDEARVTFSARVFNYSDTDVVGATVILRGPGAPEGTYAAFHGVTFSDKESVLLRQDITIPQRQYEQWRKGEIPMLLVEFQDLTGASQSKLVELINQRVGEE